MTPDNETDDGGPRLNRRNVLRATGAAAVGGVAVSSTASAHEPDEQCCEDCVRLGKVDRTPEEGDVFTFEHDGKTITIRIAEVKTEDGEVVCIAPVIVNDDEYLCGLDIKGGPTTVSYRFRPRDGVCFPGSDDPFECAEDFCGAKKVFRCAPEHERNPNRKFYEISHVVFYVCE